MEKTYLDKLTSEELKALFRKNEHLQELANELHRDNVMYWIGEELETFKDALSDWEIGFNCYNYIKIKNSALFIECYQIYIAVYSSDDKTIELVNEANDYLIKNYQDDEIDEKIEEFANELKDNLMTYFDNCLTDCDDEDELIEYLENSDILENHYIINDDLTVIYKETINSYR